VNHGKWAFSYTCSANSFVIRTKVGEAPPSQPPNNGGGNGDGQQPDQGGKSAIGWFFTM
jgi:hypothetical protein